MPRVLHILTRPDDPLAREIISRQKEKDPDGFEFVDLTKRLPDYKSLLEKIFTADSVQSW